MSVRGRMNEADDPGSIPPLKEDVSEAGRTGEARWMPSKASIGEPS